MLQCIACFLAMLQTCPDLTRSSTEQPNAYAALQQMMRLIFSDLVSHSCRMLRFPLRLMYTRSSDDCDRSGEANLAQVCNQSHL